MPNACLELWNGYSHRITIIFSRFPIPDSRFPIPDSRFPIPYFLLVCGSKASLKPSPI
ncbi:MAG: hypothetical protein F6K65_44035 [Moorea sp. SIO3C2]|nr:hypothetical protein [Moorena sp. SIO3C2]